MRRPIRCAICWTVSAALRSPVRPVETGVARAASRLRTPCCRQAKDQALPPLILRCRLLSARDHYGNRSFPRCGPPNSRKMAISEQHLLWGGILVKITTLIIVLLSVAAASGTAMIVSVKKEPVLMACGGRIVDHLAGAHCDGRDCLRGRRVHGAGIAAWMMPPV